MNITRKIILILQIILSVIVISMGIMLWTGDLDFNHLANFLGMLSILTGMVIFTSCTSPEIKTMNKFFRMVGIAGFLAGIFSSLVFWQYIPKEIWYYINLILVVGICFSLFTETEKYVTNENVSSYEKPLKLRSVVHVVASIIILLTFVLMLLHVFGWIDLKLPLIILTCAIGVLVGVVIFRNGKNQRL